MQNIIDVSQQYKNLCKVFEHQFEHEILILNLTKSQSIQVIDDSFHSREVESYPDILAHVDNLSIDKKEKSEEGNTKTNIVKFDITIHRSESTIISELIEKGDIIQIRDNFNGETTTIYTGVVQKIPEKHKNLEKTYSITVYDRLYNGIKAKFKSDEVHVAKWICNNSDTINSLAHKLAYKMGFADGELQFEDITDINGNHLYINYAYWKEGDQVLSEFTELAKAVCGKLFVNHEDMLVFSTPFNENDFDDVNITFDTNITKGVDRETIYAEYDRVKVEYAQWNIEERQVVFQYIEDESVYDEQLDEVNALLQAGDDTGWMKFDYVTPICLEIEDDSPEVLFEDNQGNPVTINYELEIDRTSGKVKFFNNNTFDIYIQRFKLYGKPLSKFEGNESTYTEITTPAKTLTVTNKYIQNEQVASLVTQYKYHLECKNREQYQFSCYYSPYLEISNRFHIDSLDIQDTATIKDVSHKINSQKSNSKITAIQYLPYEFSNSIVNSVQAKTPDYDLIKRLNSIRDNTVVAFDSKPPVPTGLSYTPAYKMIEVECNQVEREDIKGYRWYVSDGTNTNVKFETAPRYTFFAEKGQDYTVQVSAIPLKEEYESDKSDPIVVKTLEEIDIPLNSVDESKLASSLSTKINDTQSLANDNKTRLSTAEGEIDSAKLRLDQAQTDISNAETRLSTAEGELDQAQLDISSVEGRVSTNELDISTINGELSLKASQNVVDGIEGRVTVNEGNITANANEIATKVSQSEVDTLEETVSNNTTSITQNATNITAKASQSDLDTLSGTVSDNSTQISLNAQEIALKASQSVVDNINQTVSNHESRITANADSISQKVEKTQFDNLNNEVFSNTSQVKQLADEYTVKIQELDNSQEVISGFGLALEDGLSEFAVLADRFRIYKTNGEGQAVFTLDTETNQLKLLGDLIADGTITARMLSAEGLSSKIASIDKAFIDDAHIKQIKAEKILAGHLNAMVRLEGGKIVFEALETAQEEILDSNFHSREIESLISRYDKKIIDGEKEVTYNSQGYIIKKEGANGTTFYDGTANENETFRQTANGELVASNFQIDSQGSASFKELAYDNLNVNFAKVTNAKAPFISPNNLEIDIIHSANSLEDINAFHLYNFGGGSSIGNITQSYRGYRRSIVVDEVYRSIGKGFSIYIQDKVTGVEYRAKVAESVQKSTSQTTIQIQNTYLNVENGSKTYNQSKDNRSIYIFQLEFEGMNVLRGLYQADMDYFPNYTDNEDGTFSSKYTLSNQHYDHQKRLSRKGFGFGLGERAIWGAF